MIKKNIIERASNFLFIKEEIMTHFVVKKTMYYKLRHRKRLKLKKVRSI